MNFIKVGNTFINKDRIVSMSPHLNTIKQFDIRVTYTDADGIGVVDFIRDEVFNNSSEVDEWIEEKFNH